MPTLAADDTGPPRRYIGIVIAATGLGLLGPDAAGAAVLIYSIRLDA